MIQFLQAPIDDEDVYEMAKLETPEEENVMQLLAGQGHELWRGCDHAYQIVLADGDLAFLDTLEGVINFVFNNGECEEYWFPVSQK